jgi:hypothetical protein
MLFVSYSRLDLPIVRPFVQALESRGVKYWLDQANIPLGEVFVARLGDALRAATGFVLIDSENSRASYWVKRETRAAVRLKRTGVYRKLFRVTADNLPNDRLHSEFEETGDLAESLERLCDEPRPVAATGTPRVLVSSRMSPTIDLGSSTVIELREMTHDDSTRYLRLRGMGDSDASRVARTVGYHPLAATMAANVVMTQGYAVSALIQELAKDPEAHAEPLVSSVALALEHVSPGAKLLLDSMCADEAGTVENSDNLSSPVKELVQAGLVHMVDGGPASVAAVHPLIRHIVRHAQRMPEGKRER